MSTSQRPRHLWAFLGPAGLMLVAILVFPILYSFVLSLFDADGASWFSGTAEFVGIANYIKLLGDQSFLDSIWLLLVYIVTTTTVELALALVLAIVIAEILPMPAWLRTLLILPMFVLPL
ncbi:unnamed protein product, partial [marine sediment metagenome]